MGDKEVLAQQFEREDDVRCPVCPHLRWVGRALAPVNLKVEQKDLVKVFRRHVFQHRPLRTLNVHLHDGLKRFATTKNVLNRIELSPVKSPVLPFEANV